MTLETNPMSTSTTSTAVPQWLINPTTDLAVTPWYEVAAHYDSRVGLARSVAIAAVHLDGTPAPIALAQSIQIQLPDGSPLTVTQEQLSDLVTLQFPCRWRIAKPPTALPTGYVVYGYGMSTSVSDSTAPVTAATAAAA
jgi:hypothetical protein